MADSFVAEIRLFPFNFAPMGWAICAGQLMPISQNTALFSLVGTNYGGDGRTNFGLPNLQGAVAIHTDTFHGGGLYPIGSAGGETSVTLLTAEMPAHTHAMEADRDNDNASATSPNGALPVNATPFDTFSNATTPTIGGMSPAMIGVTGGGQPHNNMMPSLTLLYCIALQGIFPPRS